MIGAVLLSALTLFVGISQTGSGDSTMVRGTVTSGWPQFRPVAYAVVTAASDSDVSETRADAKGRYVFLTLLPGVYRMSAAPAGASPGAHHAGYAILTYAQKPSGGREPGANPAVARCLAEAESLVELSAGVEYLANLALATHCP